MSMWSRVKSMAGGHKKLATVASAATTSVPEVSNDFYISGTATITSLTTPQSIRNRSVTFIGAPGASVTFTNTDTLTTAGQMYLQGSNRVLCEDDVLELFCKENGTWILMNFIG